jgi:ligand-binding sensor domain-containing protein
LERYLTYITFPDRQFKHIDFSKSALQDGIIDIARGNGDTLWVVSFNRLLVATVSAPERIPPVRVASNSAFGFQNPAIQILYVDNGNNEVWLGTGRKGLMKYDVKERRLSACADLSKYDANSILTHIAALS